jgi:predicted outer membrane repeat protein
MYLNNKYFSIFLLFSVLAANAAPIVLYSGSGNESPLMESSGRTFPEPPEYYANWGSLDGMNPPYIRLSGQHGETKDWVGAFTFANLPAKISGGSLQMQARATSNASLSIWLETSSGSGNPKTYSISANQTYNLDINISDFGISMPATVSKIYVRLNQVPAWQYTTVFFDNIIFTNTESINSSSSLSISSSSSISIAVPADTVFFNDYLISADTVFLSDQTKTLGGDIYGNVLELGADTKIYGNVSANAKCFLRERANISGSMSFPFSCTKQNGIVIGKEIKASTNYAHTAIGSVSASSQNKSVAIGADEQLLPGAYGKLHTDARSTVRLRSGSYVFSNIHTEPDVKWVFDLTDGPVKIYVLDGIRFADRNTFSITGGNPSEIEWIVAGGNIDIGTDGKFFGRFIAPNSYVRLAPRSHVVGSIEARRFQMEPQATVSVEPKADEISHSEYNFGPFWNKNNFRYRSALPSSIGSVEMYVYVQNLGFTVNGGENRNVTLDKTSQKISVRITRPFMADFPSEAFASVYEFAFNKTSNYRIYWNPSSPCVSNCVGSSEETALRSFVDALKEAQKDGLEIKMTGGVYEILKEYSIFPVGFELIGIEKPFWELESFSEVPVLNVKNTSIEIIGKSPRRLAGLHVTKGTDGALKASTEKLELFNMAFTQNESANDGGAVYYGGKGIFVGRTLLLENGKSGKAAGGMFVDGDADIENLVCSGNSAELAGGCMSVQGNLRLANAVFHGNKSKKEGGAFYAKSAAVHNATAVNNESVGGSALSGVSGSVRNSIFWKNTGGDIPGSWIAQHSSFTSSKIGAGNISGAPKFIDEKNPAGSSSFFGYDAGLILADKSPALKGNKYDETLHQDLLGTERGNAVAMGAYADYSGDGEFQYGKWSYGTFEPANVKFLFENLPYQKVIDYVGYGGYGRVIKRLIRKHDKTKISQATVRITVLDSDFKAYPDIESVDVVFYRTGEEDGKYVFQTLSHTPLHPDYNPEKHGRFILFSKDSKNQGIHGNFLIIHLKNDTDALKYEVVKW